jgi:hypothetical protein
MAGKDALSTPLVAVDSLDRNQISGTCRKYSSVHCRRFNVHTVSITFGFYERRLKEVGERGKRMSEVVIYKRG